MCQVGSPGVGESLSQVEADRARAQVNGDSKVRVDVVDNREEGQEKGNVNAAAKDSDSIISPWATLLLLLQQLISFCSLSATVRKDQVKGCDMISVIWLTKLTKSIC